MLHKDKKEICDLFLDKKVLNRVGIWRKFLPFDLLANCHKLSVTKWKLSIRSAFMRVEVSKDQFISSL